MRPWEAIYTIDHDREVAQSYGSTRKGGKGKQDFGPNPALLIVDVNLRCMGTPGADLEQEPKGRSALWAKGRIALPHIQRLLEACRASKIPAIYITGDALTRHYCKVINSKGSRREPKLNLQAEDMPEEIAPLPGELIIRKTKASAFFQTSLDGCLRAMGVDSLLVCGNSTSGCVRATVLDAWSLEYRVFVVEECCYDRLELSHLVNLFDMDLKYADVITLEEALKFTNRRQIENKPN